jgi:hypothetical protein
MFVKTLHHAQHRRRVRRRRTTLPRLWKTRQCSPPCRDVHPMVIGGRSARGVRPSWYNPVRSHVMPHYSLTLPTNSYLQNGNILAARTFIAHFTAALPRTLHILSSPPIPVDHTSEVTLTKDAVVNFAQIAVLTCQRADGERNKVVREAWVKLCGTYQSKGGLLASPEIRKVRRSFSEFSGVHFPSHFTFRFIVNLLPV